MKTTSKLLPYLMALSIVLSGCGKKSDCEIPTRHVHRYTKQVTQDIEMLDSELLNDEAKKAEEERKSNEESVYGIVDAVLKVKNNVIETTHLNKEWQIKYEFIYKLCLINSASSTDKNETEQDHL